MRRHFRIDVECETDEALEQKVVAASVRLLEEIDFQGDAIGRVTVVEVGETDRQVAGWFLLPSDAWPVKGQG